MVIEDMFRNGSVKSGCGRGKEERRVRREDILSPAEVTRESVAH
jgi:hypothetical protein